MTDDTKKENSIITSSSTDLVRVGNSIEITNKIIQEHEERTIPSSIEIVKIGNQDWMKANLDVDCYSNGDPIPQVTTPEEWSSIKSGAWCYYQNDIKNKHLGKLYNWHAVNDPRGLAPLGYNIPSKEDWVKSFNDIYGHLLFAGDYESNELYKIFNVVQCGYRLDDGSFVEAGLRKAFWWSSSDGTDKRRRFAYFFQISAESMNDMLPIRDKNYGISVRCIKI